MGSENYVEDQQCITQSRYNCLIIKVTITVVLFIKSREMVVNCLVGIMGFTKLFYY